MTTVYLVRHAHADWQPSDARSLSTRGRAGAVALADRFAHARITAIYSSPSRRALETIELLAQSLRLEPVVLMDLRERELTAPTAAQFEAAVAASWREPDRPLGDGESNQAGQARGVAVVRRVVEQHRDEQVMLSTHGSLLALILHGFDGRFGYDFWRTLTFPDVYELTFRDSKLALVRRAWDTKSP